MEQDNDSHTGNHQGHSFPRYLRESNQLDPESAGFERRGAGVGGGGECGRLFIRDRSIDQHWSSAKNLLVSLTNVL